MPVISFILSQKETIFIKSEFFSFHSCKITKIKSRDLFLFMQFRQFFHYFCFDKYFIHHEFVLEDKVIFLLKCVKYSFQNLEICFNSQFFKQSTHTLRLHMLFAHCIYIYIYIYNSLIGRVISVTDYWSWGHGTSTLNVD